MSDPNSKEPAGPAPEMPSDWRLLLVDANMKVFAFWTLASAMEPELGERVDLADFLDDGNFDLAEVGELLVCLEDIPNECELRLRMGSPAVNVVARRVENTNGITCLVLRPNIEENAEKFLPNVWAWASWKVESLNLIDPESKIAPLQILVVDQNPEIVSYGRTLARKLGCRSLGAVSGGEALAQVKSHRVDVVLFDDLIPGLGASALCQLVSERSSRDWGHVPLMVAMTRDVRCHEDSDFLSLEKPIGHNELKEVLKIARSNGRTAVRAPFDDVKLPVLRLDLWENDRELLCRLSQALIAESTEIAGKLREDILVSLGPDFDREIESLKHGCDIVHATRLSASCSRLQAGGLDRESPHWKSALDRLLVEIEGFRLFAISQGLAWDRG